MKELPKASVVIAAYNAEAFIVDAINSILSQDFESFEVIVVNDGSTDQTAWLVDQLNDSRVRLITIPNSGGPSRPRNVGIRESHGNFVFIFDADDVMLPGKLRRSVELLEYLPEAGFLFTDFQSIHEDGSLKQASFLAGYDSLHRLSSCALNQFARLIKGADILSGLAKANFVGTSSVVLKRTVVEEVGFFDETLKNGDDYDLWARISSRFDAIYIDLPLHQYRLHEDSISKSSLVKRLGSLVCLHENLASNYQLPSAFRAASRRKCSLRAAQLAKECLKVGRTSEARTYARKSILMRPQNLEGYFIFLLTAMPTQLTLGAIRLIRGRLPR